MSSLITSNGLIGMIVAILAVFAAIGLLVVVVFLPASTVIFYDKIDIKILLSFLIIAVTAVIGILTYELNYLPSAKRLARKALILVSLLGFANGIPPVFHWAASASISVNERGILGSGALTPSPIDATAVSAEVFIYCLCAWCVVYALYCILKILDSVYRWDL